MRGFVFAIVGLIALAASQAAGFEVEEERDFPSLADESAVLSILSTTDSTVFTPLILAYQQANPTVRVTYTVASTTEVYSALHEEKAAFDLAVSSAMDLQMKLANDGDALSHQSAMTTALPAWARWRDQLFGFSQEPVVLLVSQRALAGLNLPETRADLIALMRENPDRFRGRIGTYDPTRSGAGYLFATQDARQSDTFWRLSEVMGNLDTKLYTGTSDMIAGLLVGDIDMAYNALGSYAAASLAPAGDVQIIELQDFTHVLLRTALIPAQARDPALGGGFLDFLLSNAGQTLLEQTAGLPRINEAALAAGPHLRPIRIDPGLLVFVDPLNRQRFLREWTAAVIQP